MYKKIIIQLLLLTLLFGIMIAVFLLYFNDPEKIVEPKLTPKEKVVAKIDDKTNTLITDLNYSYSDLSGNNYELFSDYGKIDINNSDEIHMTNVVAKIHLKNSSPITINSKYAYYDKSNHNTKFFENVVLSHLIHKATSENLDISFNDNLASMYNNIIYKKPGTQLNADRLEIDLISKNTKIFMDDKSEKIKIIGNK
tara:strand:+ start:870 stop:1460 length:591 start_codon:yes stop_codon:yes gene_type:complete